MGLLHIAYNVAGGHHGMVQQHAVGQPVHALLQRGGIAGSGHAIGAGMKHSTGSAA